MLLVGGLVALWFGCLRLLDYDFLVCLGIWLLQGLWGWYVWLISGSGFWLLMVDAACLVCGVLLWLRVTVLVWGGCICGWFVAYRLVGFG